MINIYFNSNPLSLFSRIIEFKDKETAQKAVDEMNRYEMKGRKIIVREVMNPVQYYFL